MSLTDQFAIALQAWRELIPEMGLSVHQQPAVVIPPIEQVLEDLGPMPGDSLMLGMAEDGLPLLLNLYDPAPGPVLVIGDRGSGKTIFLKTLARASDFIGDPGDVQFSVVTGFPDEWRSLEILPGCLGVWPAEHSATIDFIRNLSNWRGEIRDGRQVVLLLIDGLECVAQADIGTRQNFRRLLLHGPAAHIWPMVTCNTEQLVQLSLWTELFRTHIFGHVKQSSLAEIQSAEPEASLSALMPGLQFSLKSKEGWLHFWIPAVGD